MVRRANQAVADFLNVRRANQAVADFLKKAEVAIADPNLTFSDYPSLMEEFLQVPLELLPPKECRKQGRVISRALKKVAGKITK